MELSEQPLAVKNIVQFGLYVAYRSGNSSPQERLRRLVRSMTRHVAELHNKRGGYTRY
jgi:hypothetical protein